MELIILLALGVLFTGVSMSVAALSVGKVHIEGWGESVRQKRGGVKNIIDVPMIEIMAKLLNKFTADKRILVSINLVMVIFAIVVEATSGKISISNSIYHSHYGNNLISLGRQFAA